MPLMCSGAQASENGMAAFDPLTILNTPASEVRLRVSTRAAPVALFGTRKGGVR